MHLNIWPNNHKDLRIITLVLIYVKRSLNIIHQTESIPYGDCHPLRYRPKALVFSDLVGTNINHNIAKIVNNLVWNNALKEFILNKYSHFKNRNYTFGEKLGN